jgi:mono/diheme cytochrome c family protein
LQGWFAPNITNDNQTGVGKWSNEDIVSFLRSGHNRFSAATGPMAEAVEDSTSKLPDDDLKAIAVYLKSIEGQGSPRGPLAGQDPQMVAGQAIYRDVCSACHGIDGKGIDRLFPSVADSSVARSDPTTAIRLILRGGRSVATAPEPTAPGMPSFGWQLDDAKVAAVLTYIRNAWGRAAERVTSDTVQKQRAALESRQD